MTRIDKFGMLVAITITAISVIFVSTYANSPDSIQSQGEKVIDKVTDELTEVPQQVESIVENSVDELEELPTTTPKEVVNDLKEIAPELPPITKKTITDEKFLREISIPFMDSLEECKDADACLVNQEVVVSKHGEVIWKNDDIKPHTVTSGTPQEGPNSLFDSGLLKPGDTFSLQFDIGGEYEYFCAVHPWEQGTIWVE